ncbi:hypothetical protein FGO68_gene8721 [Halteria grandinella]|uniref:60S acidic ribosomal protein P2 n=1 Tax=Halteria grandinella TaxID=5974 RepID=A0A8J8NM79_HALGN|nr:hypothetical protein FGO68_gene8721 [Halteria grandinella]
MKHLAAYCLLALAGNAAPTTAQVEKLLKDVGVTPSKEEIDIMIKKLTVKKLHVLCHEGKQLHATAPL